MDFEEWWEVSKLKNVRAKYLAKKGWFAALNCENFYTEKEVNVLKKEIKNLKNKIEGLKVYYKIDGPSLLITRPEPDIDNSIQWIRWWREMRKINGLSYTLKESIDNYNYLIKNIPGKFNNYE